MCEKEISKIVVALTRPSPAVITITFSCRKFGCALFMCAQHLRPFFLLFSLLCAVPFACSLFLSGLKTIGSLHYGPVCPTIFTHLHCTGFPYKFPFMIIMSTLRPTAFIISCDFICSKLRIYHLLTHCGIHFWQ